MGLDPEKDVVYFAKTDFRNSNRLFGIKRKDRRQHMYVVGKTGTGKSALLNNFIVQDIANGEGLCLIDPHGELVEGLLDKIPEDRVNDVIYFNPADPDYHIGFNILEIPDPKYKHLVASGLMGIFTKIWQNVWSARMEYILNNAILALIDTPGSTLLGIPRLLTDKTYREKIIGNITDPVVKAFWINEFEQWRDQFRNEAIAPIQNKVGQFLSTALIRNIVGQSKSTIDIFDLMNTGKIFLVNLSKGRIGEDNSSLLGGMLITKIQLSAMERVRVPEDERVDFYLYVDEFQNFATDSFAGILSEARKYRLNLIIAHQYIGQLVTDMSTRVRDAVFGNAGTMIMFRVGAGDAEFLEKEFEPEFVIQDMVNLPNYSVYLKMMVDGVTCRPFSAITLPPFKVRSSHAVREKIIDTSAKRYARPRETVEDEINRWSGVMEGRGEQQTRPMARGQLREGMRGARGDVRAREAQSRAEVSAAYQAHLAGLGIEFKPSETAVPAGIVRQGGSPPPRQPAARPSPAASVSARPAGAKESISLSELKPVLKPVREKRESPKVDIGELRKAIAESLAVDASRVTKEAKETAPPPAGAVEAERPAPPVSTAILVVPEKETDRGSPPK